MMISFLFNDGHQVTKGEINKRRKEQRRLKKKTENIQQNGNKYIAISTLNVNRLSAPIEKKVEMAEWIQKQDLSIKCPQETHFRAKDKQRLKVKGQKKILHANRKKKRKLKQ